MGGGDKTAAAHTYSGLLREPETEVVRTPIQFPLVVRVLRIDGFPSLLGPKRVAVSLGSHALGKWGSIRIDGSESSNRR